MFRITLREQEWTNGDPFTSEDVRSTLMIEQLFGNPVWDLLEDVQAPDDRTVEFVLANDGDVNKELEVPMPVGDPEGSLEPFNINEKMDELATASDQDRASELITEIAWIVDQAVPVLPVIDRLGTKIWNIDRFEIPDEEHPIMQMVDQNQILSNSPEESDFAAKE